MVQSVIKDRRIYRGKFSPNELIHKYGFDPEQGIRGEVELMSKMPPNSQKKYPLLRIYTLAAYRKIVEDIFSEFVDKSPVKAAEFGAGVHGCFYNLLLPEKLKKGWKQFDINPTYVEHNKKFTAEFFNDKHAEIAVGNIYDMPLESSSIDLIVGLSSWDSISHFEQSFEELRRCLCPGGYFIHFQDIKPAEAPLIIVESKKHTTRGLPPEIMCEWEGYTQGFIIWQDHENVIAIESIDDNGKILRLGDYLTRHLIRTAEKFGFKSEGGEISSDWILQKRSEHQEPFARLGYDYDEKDNVFASEYGWFKSGYAPPIEDGHVRVKTFMDVLVAQKQ